jgi:hypothetical protein
VTLKHRKAAGGPIGDLAPAPLFTLEGERIPRHSLPQGELAPDVAFQIIGGLALKRRWQQRRRADGNPVESPNMVMGHDMADLLVGDIERQLPRLQKQAEPVHDAGTATSFHH